MIENVHFWWLKDIVGLKTNLKSSNDDQGLNAILANVFNKFLHTGVRECSVEYIKKRIPR